MSNATMAWALSQWLDPYQKMVLVAIADCVNHTTDASFPALDTIAGMACQSRRSVQRHIAALEELGLLVKEFRHAEGGRQTSNLYRINMEVRITKAKDSGDADEGEGVSLSPSGGCQSVTLGGDTGVTLGGDTGVTPINRKNKPEEEPSPLTPKGVRETRASDDDEEGFGRFFAMWIAADPKLRFDIRSRAFSAWKGLSASERKTAAVPATIDAVVAGQRRAKRTTLMNAATYLRDKAFERVDASTSATTPTELVPLSPFGRAWWCRFYEHAKAGGQSPSASKARFMAQQAERGQGVAVPLAEAQALETASASFVYVLVASPEFVAWREWFAARRMRLPTPSRADRIWMPSVLPPEGVVAESERTEGDGR
ncbi:helix-turn-helix domain-containing protein [Pleomorphomonas koreensis]|uniref:helix-turn-helix domain-containing protein n=1 Tax=Pleomorphomonas koreensis TaxID=257440 RepID=UPI0003FF09FA|nr:helix-turn-helix domain-containing protein [Pleomorphomonas koreensis]